MRLKLAIQKSGRLFDGSLALLKECGIEIPNGSKLKTEAYNFPMDILLLRDDDIPQYVLDGVADIGIVGENVLIEKGKDISTVEKLGFGKCRLSLAVPKADNYNSARDIHKKRIATSYPVLLSKFLKENKVEAEIHEISGSVEIATGIGLADAICDLVSSGSTLLMNGLKEVEVLLKSEAVLVAQNNIEGEKRELLDKFVFRIRAVKKAKHNKYVVMNVPNTKLDNVIKLIPGMKSPTILSLAEKGWSSVHSVVNDDDFWGLIENLKKEGAQGILVIPIENMVI